MSKLLEETTRQVAAESLQLNGDWTVESARGAFVRALEGVQYTPSALARESAIDVGVIPGRDGDSFALDRKLEDRLAQKIESFAETYWQIPCEARKTRWEELVEACQDFPRLTVRLFDLDQGLFIEQPKSISDPQQAALAELICELYPLKPAVRASRRHFRLAELNSDVQLAEAATALRRTHTQLGQIDNGLFDSIMKIDRPVEPVPEFRRPQPSSRSWSAQEPPNNSNRWLWILVPVGLFMCSGLVRNMGNSSNSWNQSRTGYTSGPSSNVYPGESRPGSLPPGFEKELGRILSSRHPVKPGLTPKQKKILRELARRDSLTNDEAEGFVKEFRTESVAPINMETGDDERNWDSFQKIVLSEKQRSVLERLSHPLLLTDVQLRLLLIEFVRAGKSPASLVPPTAVPPKP
jgi:hypothetical protein